MVFGVDGGFLRRYVASCELVIPVRVFFLCVSGCSTGDENRHYGGVR